MLSVGRRMAIVVEVTTGFKPTDYQRVLMLVRSLPRVLAIGDALWMVEHEGDQL